MSEDKRRELNAMLEETVDDGYRRFAAHQALGVTILLANQLKNGSKEELVKTGRGILNTFVKMQTETTQAAIAEFVRTGEFSVADGALAHSAVGPKIQEYADSILESWKCLWFPERKSGLKLVRHSDLPTPA